MLIQKNELQVQSNLLIALEGGRVDGDGDCARSADDEASRA